MNPTDDDPEEDGRAGDGDKTPEPMTPTTPTRSRVMNRPSDKAIAAAFWQAMNVAGPRTMTELSRIIARARELDASGGGGEPVAWEIQFGKDVPAMMLVQSPDFVRSEARAIKVCELLGGGTTYRALYTRPQSGEGNT